MVKVVIVMFSWPALAGDHIDHSEALKPQGLSAGWPAPPANYSVDIPAGAELCVHGGPCRAARARQHGRFIRTPFEPPHARHLHDGCPQPITGANVFRL